MQNLASRLDSNLYLVHSVMQVPEENEPDYVQKVLDRIHTSYMEKLTVTQKVFSRVVGYGPSDWKKKIERDQHRRNSAP